MKKIAKALWSGRRTFEALVAVWAIGLVFYIYLQLCLHGEFRCHEYNVPIRIWELSMVGMFLSYFVYRLIRSFRSKR